MMFLLLFEVLSIQPYVWITLLQRAIGKFFYRRIQFLTDHGYTTLADPCQFKRLQQCINSLGIHAFNIGFLKHDQQCILRQHMWFQQVGKVGALAQIGDRQGNLSNPGFPSALAMIVAVVLSLRSTFMFASTNLLLYCRFHQHLT